MPETVHAEKGRKDEIIEVILGETSRVFEELSPYHGKEHTFMVANFAKLLAAAEGCSFIKLRRKKSIFLKKRLIVFWEEIKRLSDNIDL